MGFVTPLQYKVRHICRVERYVMIFEYDELREYVEEDFDHFFQMGFNEKQIYPAVLEEYQHGENFSQAENICIHIFLALKYAKMGFHYDEIADKLKALMNEALEHEVKAELKNAYTKFVADLGSSMN